MTRSLSTIAKAATFAPNSTEVWLWFVTITHDSLAEPIRVVSEGPGSISYANGAIVNYQFDSEVYLGCPFMLEWVTDDEKVPRGRITVPDVDRTIGIEVLLLTDSPRIAFCLLKLSDYGASFGANNERLPVGVLVPEVSADFFFLRNVSGDALQVQGDITVFDYATEPWPRYRATPDRLPWIAR